MGANFKMRCVDNAHNEAYYTTGKVYEVVGGFFKDDCGDRTPITPYRAIKNLEDWKGRTTAKWELVEEPEEMKVRIEEIKIPAVIKCEVCGREFTPSFEHRYTARRATFLALVTDYDAFDCPYCGCQHIAGERISKMKEVEEIKV